MEPRIQYAKTADGVSIAFWTLGEGRPLVYMANPPFTHIRGEWQNPEMGTFYRRLAECCRLIRYDRRGCGLSDRNTFDFSLGATIRDLESVVDALGLERFALLGILGSGLTAIAYAAHNPDRLTHLILQNCYARGADFAKAPGMREFYSLAGSNWEMFTETAAHLLLGWSAGEAANRMAAYFRECVSKEAVIADGVARHADDVTDLLPHVRTPTLVIYNRRAGVGPDVMDPSRALASGIGGARLAVIDQGWAMDVDAEVGTIKEFLGEGEEEAPPPLPAGMTAILFADIADSTGVTERLGDVPFREKARALDATLRGVIRENGGTPVEGRLLGDGVLAVFTSARQAIEAALACGAAGASAGMPLHLGLHAGDVIREEGNVYGGAVNIAARISALSAPGEILVSGTVRSLARTSAGPSVEGFEDRGERELKGVGEPVRVWAVRGQEGA